MSLRMEVIIALAENGDYLPDSWLEEYIEYRLGHSKLSSTDKFIASMFLFIILHILYFLFFVPA